MPASAGLGETNFGSLKLHPGSPPPGWLGPKHTNTSHSLLFPACVGRKLDGKQSVCVPSSVLTTASNAHPKKKNFEDVLEDLNILQMKGSSNLLSPSGVLAPG